MAYLGDVLPLPLDEFIDKLLSGQMQEIYQLGEETDKDLAMTRYYKRKIRLLELQAKILKLLFNADNKQKQRIEMLDEGLMKLLEDIRTKIFTIRGKQVMLDRDLATLYKVETRSINQAVKRNQERFPEFFSFLLTEEELSDLRSQTVISSSKYGGRRYTVRVFETCTKSIKHFIPIT